MLNSVKKKFVFDYFSDGLSVFYAKNFSSVTFQLQFLIFQADNKNYIAISVSVQIPQEVQVLAVDWIFSSRIKFVVLKPILGDLSVEGGSRAVLDILEVTGRVSWRARCLKKTRF